MSLLVPSRGVLFSYSTAFRKARNGGAHAPRSYGDVVGATVGAGVGVGEGEGLDEGGGVRRGFSVGLGDGDSAG